MPKRVLIVSYYSPPYGGTQSFRLVQFTKHLPQHGWLPTVLTAKTDAFEESWRAFRDERSFSLADSEVVRVSGRSHEWLALALRGTESSRQPPTSADTGSIGAAGNASAIQLHDRLFAGLSEAAIAIGSVLASPDRHISWAPRAVWKGIPQARAADLVYACGPPFTNHIVGVALSRLTGKPLVVMIDDPWISMQHRQWRTDLQRRIQSWQERTVLRHARAILTGTYGFRDDLAARHGHEVGEKTHVIHWGFDPDDYPPIAEAPSRNSGPFELIYTGSLRGEQYDISTLLEVLRQWSDDRPDLPNRFRLRIIGGVEPRYRELATRLRLDGIVRFEGFAPHRDLVTRAASADAALLFINDSNAMLRNYTSGKIFHYMGLRLPVLALVPPDGEAAALMRQKHLGLIAAPHDAPAIRTALKAITETAPTLAAQIADCNEYSSGAVIAKAAQVFDQAVNRGNRERSEEGGQ